MNYFPKISIITVVYNNKKGLEETIKSVINQTYKNIEYIIIDGSSTDGTVDILKKHQDNIDYWISEPDRGIYDGMNKGAKQASGEYLYFLNSSDYLFDNDVIRKIVESIKKNNVDLIVGRVIGLYHDFKTFYSPVNMSNLKFGKMLPHQGSFIRNNAFKKIGCYNIKYKTSGDFDFFCKFYKKKLTYQLIENIIAYMPSGGFGSVMKNLTLKEGCIIIHEHFDISYALLFYFKKVIIEQGIKNLFLFLGLRRVYEKLLKIKIKGFN